jgi:hypothetical protein
MLIRLYPKRFGKPPWRSEDARFILDTEIASLTSTIRRLRLWNFKDLAH